MLTTHFDQCTGGEYEVLLIKAVPFTMLLGQEVTKSHFKY